QQPARCPCALSLQGRTGHALSYPWNQRALDDRQVRVVRLHPHVQPGHHRSAPPRAEGLARRCARPRTIWKGRNLMLTRRILINATLGTVALSTLMPRLSFAQDVTKEEIYFDKD